METEDDLTYSFFDKPGIIESNERLEQNAQQAQNQTAETEVPDPSSAVAQPEQPEQPQQPEAQQPEQPEAQPEEPAQYSPNQVIDGIAAAPLGVIDAGFDIAGVLGFKKADEWWDTNSPRSTNPWINAIRDLAGVIGPSLLLARFGIKGMRGATRGVNLSARTRKVGEIGLELGTDAAVAATVSAANMDSEENIGNFLENVLGITAPWAIREEDSPDVRFAKNMAENTGIGGFASLLTGFFSMRKGAQLLKEGTDEVVETVSEASKPVTGDALVDAVNQSEQVKNNNIVDRGVRALEEDPWGDAGYNPAISNIAEDTALPASTQPIDPLSAKVDQFRISKNIGTSNGTAAPVVSEGFQKMAQTYVDPAIPTEELVQVAEAMSPRVDMAFNGNRFIAKDIEINTDEFVSRILKQDGMTQDEYREYFRQAYLVGERATKVEGVETLSSVGYNTATEGYLKVLSMFDPEVRKARGFVVQQSASEASNAARGIGIIGEFADTVEQQKIVWDRIQVVAEEIRLNQKLSSEMLRSKAARDLGTKFTAAEVTESAERIAGFRSAAVAEAKVFRDSLEEIYNSNREYFTPFYKLLTSTNGEADTIAKMREYMKKRTGFWKKAFYDGEPEIPSYLIKALQSIKYGNILMVRAPISAAIGNATMLALKPINMFAGSVGRGNTKEMLWTFGGFGENLGRGFEAFRREWREVTSSPLAAAKRQRSDIDSVAMQMQEMEDMERFFAAERKAGRMNLGTELGWRATKLFSYIANTNTWRFGANAMTAIDGFTKSFIASGEARNRAYRSLLPKLTEVSPDEFKRLFDAKQREIYGTMFDDSGMLIDDVANNSSKQITLQAESQLANNMENFARNFPAVKPLFMFPRTGVNALNMAWSYVPGGQFMMGMKKQSSILNAKSLDEIKDALRTNGINPDAKDFDVMGVFQNLKSEYMGRQMTGAAVITMAGMLALNGNLTGAGPRDQAQKRRMIKYEDFYPFSIRNPINGQWVSYAGLEPFSTILGLTADVVWETSGRLDQDIGEDFFRKILYSMSSNISNKTFLSGFEPLTKLIGGDESAFQLLAARELDSLLPFTSARGVLNEVIYPQALEVQRDFEGYFAARNKFMTGPMGLVTPAVDIYDGKEIRMWEPMQMSLNALTNFKSNTGSEPWRQYATSIGWEGLSPRTINPITKLEMTPQQKTWVNNWIGRNMPFKEVIEDVMAQDPDGKFVQEVLRIRENRRKGGFEKKEFDIGRSQIHQYLDRELNRRILRAFNAMQRDNPDLYQIGRGQALSNKTIESGDSDRAREILEFTRPKN